MDKLLPLLISSEIHKSFEEGSSSVFNIHLDHWLNDPEKASHLKLNYSEELSIINMINNDFFAGAHYMERSLKEFLKDWSTLNVFWNQLRLRKLLDIQKTSEIQMFIYATKYDDKYEYAAAIRRLIKKWLNNMAKPSDSLLIWESKLGYRTVFTKYIKKQLRTLPSEFEFINEDLDDCKVSLK